MRIQSEIALKRCQEQLKTWYAAKSPGRLPSAIDLCSGCSVEHRANQAVPPLSQRVVTLGLNATL